MKYDLTKNFTEAVDMVERWIRGRSEYCIYLHGELGSGKTYFVRELIHRIYPAEKVFSPTYTLVNLYQDIYHLDLYRIKSESELEELGLEDMTKILVEWPRKWALAENPAELFFHFDGEKRSLKTYGFH